VRSGDVISACTFCRVLFALFTVFSMCCKHVSLLSRVTSRYFTESLYSSGLLFDVSVFMFLGERDCCCFVFV
jgi:hypothetical protein